MVLESLVNPSKAEGRPWEMFFIGLVYASVAIFLSLWIFEEYSSLVMIFLTVTATVPFMYNIIAYEEAKDDAIEKETILLKEHTRALKVFMFLFLGYLIAFSFWYVVLPTHVVEKMFSVQLKTIETINADITGKGIAAKFVMDIFSNNIKVLIFCILFAFIFGAGAIFILTWNASVIAAASGGFIKHNISIITERVGLAKISGYFSASSVGILRYALHGIPEILAYFMAGLAGGIISVAVIRHDFGSKKFRHILTDSVDLIVLAIVVLLIAALLEVFVTPRIF
jgi:uncharacterized membrane protein SpoIIM required for sporulation